MNSHTTYVWSDNFCATSLDDKLVTLVIESGKYYSFAKTGKAILQLLEQPKTLDEIVDSLVARYDVPVDVCATETSRFISELEAGGLITKGA